MRFCEVINCGKPVWGTDKKTRTGYCKSHQHLRTDISKESIIQKAIAKQRKNAVPKIQSKLRSLSYSSPELKDAERKIQTKSQLLQQADRLFSEFIKARDTKNGKIYCPCCKEYLREGNADINCMHFIDRDVYLLRFDEDAAHAGHGNCNRNQHYNPSGKEYQNFKQFLIDKFGEVAVEEMELAKRKINKITEQQLKTIIEHYSQQ